MRRTGMKLWFWIVVTSVFFVSSSIASGSDGAELRPKAVKQHQFVASNKASTETSIGEIAKAPNDYVVEIFDRLLPLLTFIGGLLFVVVQNWWARRCERKNIRFILLQEITANYKNLNSVMLREAQNLAEITPFQVGLLGNVGHTLSIRAYNEYFGKLSILSPELVEKLYDTYTTISRNIEDAERYKEYSLSDRSMKNPTYAAHVARAVVPAQRSFQKTCDLLAQFDEGRLTIEECKSQQGDSIDTMRDIGRWLGVDEDD
jgi:hypothetical protein